MMSGACWPKRSVHRPAERPARSSLPVEEDAPGVPGVYPLEGALELRVGETVCDHGLDVEAAVEHHRHLVPGLVHLAAVDALDREHAEDDDVPVDGDLARGDSQHGDLGAVRHV